MAGNKVETSRRTLAVVLVMALIGAAAGGAGLYVTETYSEHFEIPEELKGLTANLSEEQTQKIDAASLKAEFQNTTLVMGLFGLAHRGPVGVGHRLDRALGGEVASGTIARRVIGSAAGAGAGYAGLWLSGWLESSTQWDITLRTCVTHAAVWSIIGVGVGLAAGLLVAPRLKSTFKAIGALIGAGIVAGMLYPFLAAVLLPSGNPDRTIPEGLANRAFWRCSHRSSSPSPWATPSTGKPLPPQRLSPNDHAGFRLRAFVAFLFGCGRIGQGITSQRKPRCCRPQPLQPAEAISLRLHTRKRVKCEIEATQEKLAKSLQIVSPWPR